MPATFGPYAQVLGSLRESIIVLGYQSPKPAYGERAASKAKAGHDYEKLSGDLEFKPGEAEGQEALWCALPPLSTCCDFTEVCLVELCKMCCK